MRLTDCASDSICGCVRPVTGVTRQTPICRSAPAGTKPVETVALDYLKVGHLPRRRSSSFP